MASKAQIEAAKKALADGYGIGAAIDAAEAVARTDRPNKHEQALLDVLRNKLCDAADENIHPEDQYGILRDTLKDLLAPELFDAYEGNLEGFICADKYNARAKR